MTIQPDLAKQASWRAAPAYALPIAAIVLSLNYYWFAIADRYIIFLYNHDMGPIVPDTAPFSRVTASRYWMAGLVASGAIMILYVGINWLLGRLFKEFTSPDWRQVWVWASLPLSIGIPLISMTVNNPTLPFKNAAQATVVTLLGLALALLPGQLAARRPGQLIWLAFDGLSLMLIMTTLNNLDNIGSWLARGATQFVVMVVIMLAAGLFGLLFITGVQMWRKTAVSPWRAIFLAGLCINYLFMPLLHHTLFTDGYFYITDSDNFFAKQLWLQVVSWIAVALLAAGIARLRQRALDRR